METFTTPQYELFLLWTFPHQLFISLGNGTFKCSVGFFLIRVGTKRWGRWVLCGLMLFITISSLVYGSTLFWSCIPLRANWHFDEQKNAKMISNKVWMGLAMWNSVANMLTDSILAFFPMPIVLRMKVSTSKKVALVVALSLGWLTVVCGAVKTWVMWNYFTANDKYYKDLYFVWCFMEMSVGSIAASVPLLQPLVNRIRRSSSSRNDSGKVVLMPLPGAMPATPPQVKMRRPIITWTGMGFTSFQDGEEFKYDDPERSGSSTRYDMMERSDSGTIFVGYEGSKASPQKYSSTNMFNASSFSPDCLANIAPPSTYPDLTASGRRVYVNFVDQVGNPQSEDCLTLNIWTKATTNPKPKAVLLWIHGGRYSIPGTHGLFYQGQYLADQEDVIDVTINHCINIFGYPGAPGETQNPGLLDHRMAFEWVRDKIAGFGGDPHRITSFAQSAGGGAIDFYAYAWKKESIVAGLVSQSGTALIFAINSPNMSAKYWYTAASYLGRGDSGNVMSCMRSKDFNILKAAAKVPYEPSQQRRYTNPSSILPFAKIPYLAGNVDYEADFYKLAAWAINKTLAPAQWDDFNLAGFTCPTGTETANRANYDVPSWRYRYFGD
ncbi:cholinesterase, partial [Aureobasidium melanogenum]